MAVDMTVKVGGEAGQGIQTIGQLIALTLHNAGYYVMAVNDFESRIRGGHSFYQIRLSDQPVEAPLPQVHLLVAMDERTVALHTAELAPGGVAITDSRGEIAAASVLRLPLSAMADQAGGAIMANTVAAAAALALLGAPWPDVEQVVQSQFAGREAADLERNLRAARLGFDAAPRTGFGHALKWPATHRPKGMLLEGSQALALGALAGDCRFGAFYPMSPATGIMLHLAARQGDFPLVIEQAEDEIAAVNMVMGAAFAGVRALTATSGGGFALMTEGLGLAGITETPLVIIDAQRPGPATGLPTRTAQGDLQFVLRAAPDDFPRVVFAPASPAEGFALTARALDLAEKYQVPAILLVDQYFNDALFTVEEPLAVPTAVVRHLAAGPGKGPYLRYRDTPSGVSPRRLPCRGPELVTASGNEHGEDGHLSETVEDRTRMVAKRTRKLSGLLGEMRPPGVKHGTARTLLVGWGSSRGAIAEAVERLRGEGLDVGCVHFTELWPFRADAAVQALGKASRRIVVEQNASGQFADLLRQETGLTADHKILKVDGRPFDPVMICTQTRHLLG